MMQITIIAQCEKEELPMRVIQNLKGMLGRNKFVITTLNMEVIDVDQPAGESPHE